MGSTAIPTRVTLGVGLMTLILTACSGGGDPAASDPVTPTGPGTATVGVLITDSPPALDIDEANATITRIELISDRGHQVIFSGRETIDLLRLADFSEPLAVSDIEAGTYSKIRMIVERLELVTKDGRSIDAELPGKGKLDINPQGPFFVAPNSALLIEIDFDMRKSVHVIQTGNGRVKVRPVIFARIMSGSFDGKLARVHGEVAAIDEMSQSFRLCQTKIVARGHDDDDDDEFEHCFGVFTDNDTGIFDSNGDPAEFSAVMVGTELTAIGRFHRREAITDDDDCDDDSNHDDDDDCDDDCDDDSGNHDDCDDDGDRHDRFALEAYVLELGPLGSFIRVSGDVESAVDADTKQFTLDPDPGQPFSDDSVLSVLLQDGTRIFSRRGVELSPTAIQPGIRALVDGVLNVSTMDALLKSSLVILNLDDLDFEDVLRGKVLSVDEENGTLRMATESGDRCVVTDDDTDIFIVFSNDDGFLSERGDLGDLETGQRIDVFGKEQIDGCFEAGTIIADGGPKPPGNSAPVADAGDDQEVATGTPVTLDGTGSTDPDGDMLSYSWTLPEKPEASTAELANANTAMPSFTPDLAGTYVARLVVNDGMLDSEPDTVTITATESGPGNRAPIADAGMDDEVVTGEPVTLDGTGSTDPDGDTLSYAWTLPEKPEASTAELANADTAMPSFTPDLAGMYVARLVVNDGMLDSEPDTVTITAATVGGIDGRALYAQWCEACHDPIDQTNIRDRTAQAIQDAIDKNKGSMGSLDFLTPEQIEAIAQALPQ